MKTQLVILDRDGVINYDSFAYIKSPEELLFIPGSLEAIAELNRADYTVAVATNQSGIGRGLFDQDMLDRIHTKLVNELAKVGGAIDEIFFCPHHPEDHCGCRKPKLGLFHQIQKKYSVDLANTYFIGDSKVDMQAALALPCKPILVLTSNGEKTLREHPEYQHIPHFVNLSAAVEFILREKSS
jgi:D-glycero-D-manno-heptose 1,7-bisphosphate phosphatase